MLSEAILAEIAREPRWMRCETFSRLVLDGRGAADEADWIMLGKLGIALASTQAGRR
jgi:hypothetical protein